MSGRLSDLRRLGDFVQHLPSNASVEVAFGYLYVDGESLPYRIPNASLGSMMVGDIVALLLVTAALSGETEYLELGDSFQFVMGRTLTTIRIRSTIMARPRRGRGRPIIVSSQ